MIETHPYYNFYQYKDHKYNSKIFAAAAAYMVSNGKDITKNISWCLFNFEMALDRLDLLVEPEKSLQEFYLDRAIHLRNNYDYLILNYSGGPDSHQILETFMLNGIFLDEIFIYSHFDEGTIDSLYNNDSTTFAMFPEFYEAQRSAIPIAKYLVETYSPATKITYIDNFYKIHKTFWENINEKNFLEDIKGNASVMLTHRHIVRSRNPNFSKECKDLKQKKNTAHIWGLEKPHLVYDDTGVFFVLEDHTIRSRIDLQHLLTTENIPNNHELFYIHPCFADMFLKRAHVIHKNFSKDFFNNPKSPASSRKNENELAKVLYSFKTKLPYMGLKISDLLSRYDDYPILKELSKTGIIPGYVDMVEPLNMKLYVDSKNSLASINYDKFVDFLYQNLFKYVDKRDFLHNLCKGLPSKRYYIKYFS
jgi:hypothetical protein